METERQDRRYILKYLLHRYAVRIITCHQRQDTVIDHARGITVKIGGKYDQKGHRNVKYIGRLVITCAHRDQERSRQYERYQPLNMPFGKDDESGIHDKHSEHGEEKCLFTVFGIDLLKMRECADGGKKQDEH